MHWYLSTLGPCHCELCQLEIMHASLRLTSSCYALERCILLHFLVFVLFHPYLGPKSNDTVWPQRMCALYSMQRIQALSGNDFKAF